MGGCQCGAVRFGVQGEASALYICHCRECRKQSASAFGMSLQCARGAVTVMQGAPVFWSRGTDSGGVLACAFCGVCGSRLWHEGKDGITVKAGALDEPVDASAAIHIWVSRKLPGVVIPDGAVMFPEEPG